VRVFLAGASGVLGVRLIPLLVAAGHDVTGMTRSPDRAEPLRALGATPVVADVYDADAVRAAVVASAPALILDELTDLPDDRDRLEKVGGGANARIRRIGTRNLLEAAIAAGVERFIVQSVAWTIAGDGGAAVAEMEQMVLEAGGVVLRYGQFHGPGTYHPEPPAPPRVHIDEAARQTVALLDAPKASIVTVVDEG
jgi:nucleoside-diphosphate-sugar epimerase